MRAAVDAEVTQLSQRIRALNNQIISDREYLVQSKHNLDDVQTTCPTGLAELYAAANVQLPYVALPPTTQSPAALRRATSQYRADRRRDRGPSIGRRGSRRVGWTDAVESIRQDLRSRVPDEQVLNSMAEELALLEAAQHDLNAVLAEAPSR